jgi:hypothetical protein
MPAKKIGPEFMVAETLVRKTWEFAVDGGAVGTVELFEADGDVVLTHFHAYVKTTCTSGGSATVALGITGTTDLFVNTTEGAVANLTANAVLKPNALADLPTRLASGSKVLMTIGTAALTAGKIEVVVQYMAA